MLVLVVVVGWWFFAHREVDRAAVGPTPPELVNSQQCDRSRNDTASQGRLGVAGGSVVGEFRLKAVLVERPDEVRIRVGLNGASQVFGERDPDGDSDDVVVEVSIDPGHEVSADLVRPDRDETSEVGAVVDFNSGVLRVAFPQSLLTDSAGYEWGANIEGRRAGSSCSQTEHLIKPS